MVHTAAEVPDAVEFAACIVHDGAVETIRCRASRVEALLRQRDQATDGVGREVDEVLPSLGVLNPTGEKVQQPVPGLLDAVDEVDTFTRPLDLALDAQAVQGVDGTRQPVALPEVDVGDVGPRAADQQKLLQPRPVEDAAGEEANGNSRLLFPKQAERFRWCKWRFGSGIDLRDFVRDEVFPYMASLVKEEPQIAEYFRDAVLEIVDPNVLKQVVDEIDGIDFAKLGTDVKGDIFEYLLTHLGQSALNGQFRTPRQIRTMMVEMVDPDLHTHRQ